MPFYHLICTACGETFECRASIAARTENTIVCPSCGSRDVRTDYTAGCAAVVAGSEPESAPCPHGGGCCACQGKH